MRCPADGSDGGENAFDQALALTVKRQQRRLPFYLSVHSATAKLDRNLSPTMRTKLRRTARAIRVRGNRITSLNSKTPGRES